MCLPCTRRVAFPRVSDSGGGYFPEGRRSFVGRFLCRLRPPKALSGRLVSHFHRSCCRWRFLGSVHPCSFRQSPNSHPMRPPVRVLLPYRSVAATRYPSRNAHLRKKGVGRYSRFVASRLVFDIDGHVSESEQRRSAQSPAIGTLCAVDTPSSRCICAEGVMGGWRGG